jgi:hypothetical protein
MCCFQLPHTSYSGKGLPGVNNKFQRFQIFQNSMNLSVPEFGGLFHWNYWNSWIPSEVRKIMAEKIKGPLKRAF